MGLGFMANVGDGRMTQSNRSRMMMKLMLGMSLLVIGGGCTEAEFARLTGLLPAEPVVKEPLPLDLSTPPLAYGESYTTFRDETLKVRPHFGVLRNDQFVLQLFSFAGVTEQGGFVELENDGSFVYSPPAGFMGADHFSYTVENERGSDTATVLIKIVPFESVPVPSY